jgi:hypothetical protein
VSEPALQPTGPSAGAAILVWVLGPVRDASHERRLQRQVRAREGWQAHFYFEKMIEIAFDLIEAALLHRPKSPQPIRSGLSSLVAFEI